jgi:hypothetical protein
MFSRQRGDPQIVFRDSRASPRQIGLDVAIMLRRELVRRQDGADPQKLLKLFQSVGLVFRLESAVVKFAQTVSGMYNVADLSRSAKAGSRRKWAMIIDVSSRTLSVAFIQLLAAFGDNPLQFVGFLAR